MEKAKKLSWSVRVKIAMLERNMTVAELAKKIGLNVIDRRQGSINVFFTFSVNKILKIIYKHKIDMKIVRNLNDT